MVTPILAFLTSFLCAACIAIIELFHMDHMKQPNGILFWRTVDACIDKFTPLSKDDVNDPGLDSPV